MTNLRAARDETVFDSQHNQRLPSSPLRLTAVENSQSPTQWLRGRLLYVVSYPASSRPAVVHTFSYSLSIRPAVVHTVSYPVSTRPSVVVHISYPVSIRPAVVHTVSYTVSTRPSVVVHTVSYPVSIMPAVVHTLSYTVSTRAVVRPTQFPIQRVSGRLLYIVSYAVSTRPVVVHTVSYPVSTRPAVVHTVSYTVSTRPAVERTVSYPVSTRPAVVHTVSYPVSTRPAAERTVSYTVSTRAVVRPIQFPIQWVLGSLYLRVKQSGFDSDHSAPSNSKAKNSTFITSPLPHVFVMGFFIKQRLIYLLFFQNRTNFSCSQRRGLLILFRGSWFLIFLPIHTFCYVPFPFQIKQLLLIKDSDGLESLWTALHLT